MLDILAGKNLSICSDINKNTCWLLRYCEITSSSHAIHAAVSRWLAQLHDHGLGCTFKWQRLKCNNSPAQYNGLAKNWDCKFMPRISNAKYRKSFQVEGI